MGNDLMNKSFDRNHPNGRRRFLEKCWWLVKASGILVVSYPMLRFLDFRTPRKPQHFKVYKTLQPGGFVVERDFVLFEGGQGPWAISRKCTHLGCRLNFVEKENMLVCPCHQSRFTKTGKRVSGPARKDLPTFQVAKMAENEGKGYIVTL